MGIFEDRYQVSSTILASQLSVAKRHEQIGYSTLAERIPDRLLHSAHRVEHCNPDRQLYSAAVRYMLSVVVQGNDTNSGREGSEPEIGEKV